MKSVNRLTNTSTGGLLSLIESINGLLFSIFSILAIVAVIGVAGLIIMPVAVIYTIIVIGIRSRDAIRWTDFERSSAKNRKHVQVLEWMLYRVSPAAEMWGDQYRGQLQEYWRQIDAEVQQKQSRLIFVSHIMELGAAAILFTGQGIIIAFMYGSLHWLTPVIAIAGIQAMRQIFDIVDQITEALRDSMQKKALFEDFISFESMISEGNDTRDIEPVLTEKIELEFDNVCYKYPGTDEMALINLSFKIKAGENIVLVGQNGAGKSTIIRLLLGLDYPTSGKILVNGRHLEDFQENMDKGISVLFQDFFTYELSVLDNITVSQPKTVNDLNKLKESIQFSELEKTIEELPQGLDTLLTDASSMSGGQWQRLALSRAKYRDCSMMILDEPVAALDAIYEAKLYTRFYDLSVDKTTIIVSHRLPVCQMADRIFVIEDGKLQEEGEHDKLLKAGGIYSKLFNAQTELYGR